MNSVVKFQTEKVKIEHHKAFNDIKLNASPFDDHAEHIQEHTVFLNYLLNFNIISENSKVYKKIVQNIREHQAYLNLNGLVYNYEIKKLEKCADFKEKRASN